MKILTFIFLNLFCFIGVTAQNELTDDFKPSGKASGKVFWNYNYNFSEDADQRNTFALNRVYLGYTYNISKKISTTIILDGAKKSEASEFTVFAKNAQLDWKLTDEINLSLGLIGLKQIDTQEKFWGYRYVFKTLQDEFKLGTTADLGVNIEVNPAPKLKANIFVLNGEGYTKLQDELGLLKIGGSILFEPVSWYGDPSLRPDSCRHSSPRDYGAACGYAGQRNAYARADGDAGGNGDAASR